MELTPVFIGIIFGLVSRGNVYFHFRVKDAMTVSFDQNCLHPTF